jgi:modulator of FtsH protease HflK
MRRLGWVAIALLLAYLLTGVTQVRPGERAVVCRFGRVAAMPGPGLWVGLPWGLDAVDRVAVDRLRHVTVGYEPDPGGDGADAAPPGQLLTGDQNLVDVQVVIGYAVSGEAVADYAAARDRVDGAIARAAEAALAEWVAGRSVDDVLLTGKAALPGWLETRLGERLGPYRLGVEVRAAAVTHLAPPEAVNHAFVAVTSAQSAIRTRELDAGREAETRRRQAEATAYALSQSAAAAAHGSRAQAGADVLGFRQRLAQYQRSRRTNPEVLTALWWDELGPLFAKLRAAGRLDVLDAHLGPDGLDIMQVGPRAPKK